MTDRTLAVDLWYPGVGGPGSIDEIQIALMHVRAANDLIVSYDFDRDGWVLSMENDDGSIRREVGFVAAWAVE